MRAIDRTRLAITSAALMFFAVSSAGCLAPTDDGSDDTQDGEESGSSEEALANSTVVAQARARLGKPYVWGGVGPNGYDCSGLVQTVFRRAGRTLPRVSQAQYNSSIKIAASSRVPGDLVFFGTPTNIYHVGIYVGAGRMIDAPHTGAVVREEAVWAGARYGRYN